MSRRIIYTCLAVALAMVVLGLSPLYTGALSNNVILGVQIGSPAYASILVVEVICIVLGGSDTRSKPRRRYNI